MDRARGWRVLVVLAALALIAGACGDDDDDEATGSPDDTNALEVTMQDYSFAVSGSLQRGVQSFATENTGEEIHMMGVGKLKAGKGLADVQAALGDEDEAAFEAVFESELGTPGHILFPGERQTITLEEGIDPGTYAMICFLPTEGDGAPHFTKGMVSTFEVETGDDSGGVPDADASYTLDDEAVADGPTELDAGSVTLQVTNDGKIGKDFIIGQVDEGKDFDAFDTYFEEVFEGEGGPPKGAAGMAPGRIAFSTFEIEPGQSIFVTVELAKGTWFFVNTTNSDSEDGEEAVDKILEVTVG